MFGQKDDELRRLEQELLQEEQPREVQPEDEDDGILFEDETDLSSVQVPYRNFANGYQAYTNQPADVDMEQYSEEVRTGSPKTNRSLVMLALILFICIMLVLCWWVWRYAGVLL